MYTHVYRSDWPLMPSEEGKVREIGRERKTAIQLERHAIVACSVRHSPHVFLPGIRWDGALPSNPISRSRSEAKEIQQ